MRTTFTTLAATLLLLLPEYMQAIDSAVTSPPISSAPSIKKDDKVMSAILPAPRTPRFYGGVEYLLWWVKAAPLSVPLVSTGSTSFKEGFLVNSTATVLYGAPHSPASGGDDTQGFPAFSGSRLTLGYWFDEEQHFGVEGSGFLLESRSAGYEARGDSNGNFPAGSSSTGMRIPVYNDVPYSPGGGTDPETGASLVPKTEDGVPLSIPGDLTGGVKITNKLQFWGADVGGVINFYRTPAFELSGLAGIRYLNLYESFNLNADIEGLSTSDLYSGQSGTVSDRFQTRNQFFGGNFGLRGRYITGPLSVEMSGRIALGDSHEVLNVNGFYTASNFKSQYASGPEGIFAQPANEGRTSSDRFAVVPEVQIKLGYALTARLRATISYDFLFYSNVVRPGDQINRNIPKGQTFQQDGTAASTSSPSKLFKTSEFFAHGVSVGFEYSF
jgi:hypothetical protein